MLGSLFFGCIDCCSVDENLRSAFPQSGKSCPAITFHSTEIKVLLRQIIFFPVLWKRHFTVMWYSKSSSTLTLYKSTSDCDSALIQAIEKNMTVFLSSFHMPAPVLQHGELTLQTDSSSCGVCVCYTIGEIASRSLNLGHAPFCVDDVRA